MIQRLLIANRGEIACRIISSARRMGIFTIAVYSEADQKARHVREADMALPIGPAPARESYLLIDNILAAAREAKADAIHPGYGFLSENADFADAVVKAGLVFVGPPASAMRAMGDKANAKILMHKANVPLLPGYEGADQTLPLLQAEAEKIGFPLLIKPSAGGGGKGMKIVRAATEFASALSTAQREAQAAFGDARVILERYLDRPRHVEVQVFTDTHGNAVHLFERDCTPQRRYQKVIEEAPALGIPEKVRQQLHETAVNAAKAVSYVGAGTVEFLLDDQSRPYFMEMNTRLQVEHPVTEAITGLDLVEWQLRIAQGEHLPLSQNQIKSHGHAVEARLYAEDATQGFLPQTGMLEHLAFPPPEAGWRVDSGVEAGDAITIHYDPMIAKLIVHAHDRDSALNGLHSLLSGTQILGLTTNRDFLRRLCNDADYRARHIDTGWLDRVLERLTTHARPPMVQAAQIAAQLWQQAQQRIAGAGWQQQDYWRTNIPSRQQLELLDDEGQRHVLSVAPQAAPPNVDHVMRGAHIQLYHDGECYAFTRIDPLAAAGLAPEAQNHLRAPMPGRIIAVMARPDQKVSKGTPLVTLEAMKMEHVLKAPTNGYVRALYCTIGDQVEEGVELLEWEAEHHDE